MDAAFHREVHGLKLRPTMRSALRGYLYEVREDLRFVHRTRARDWLASSLRSPVLRAAQLAGLDDETVQKLVWGNAAGFYGIE